MERTGKAAEHYEKAEDFWNNDDYEKAIAEYGEVIKLLPNDAESYGGRGQCYNSLEQWDKALADLDKAISLDSGNSDYYALRGRVQAALGKIEKGGADTDKAATLAPNQAGRFYFVFGKLLEDAENNSEAAKYYKKSVSSGGSGNKFSDKAKEKLAALGM